jgi:2-C-methyl-D-erythritol 2,4-cyclodiphosphate synthase
MIRIGHGYDIHRFTTGDHITLGGVKIPFHQGIDAHSDGDVVLHAVCDALLGAAALGDIGQHFPDNDPQYKNIDSRHLLKQVWRKVQAKGFELANLDTSILAQAPKLSPYIKSMQQNLAVDLGVNSGQLNIKATTTEGLGAIGQCQGIAAYTVVLLVGTN